MSEDSPRWMKQGRANREKLDRAVIQQITSSKTEYTPRGQALDFGAFKSYEPMYLQEHIKELWGILRRIVKIVLMVSVLVIIVPGYSGGKLLVDPYTPLVLQVLNGLVNYTIISAGSVPESEVRIFVGSPLTLVSLYINIALFIAVLVSIPITVHELVDFVKPGLSELEYETMKKIVFYSILLFLLGAFISYFIILPLMLRFLVSTAGVVGEDNLLQLYSLSSVLSIMLWGTLGGGILYASPMILVAMVNLGVLGPDQLKHRRREIYMGIFFLAALITPDPTMVSMTILSVPLIGVVEGIVIWSFKVQLKRMSEDYYDY